MNSKEFSLKIESIVKEKRIPYMDAVIDYCKLNDIDVGTINSMVNKSLKSGGKIVQKWSRDDLGPFFCYLPVSF